MAQGYGSKADIAVMEGLVARLEALSDPTDASMCVIDPKHKEGVRIYVESWMLPAAEAVLAHLRDGERVEEYLALDGKQAARRRRAATKEEADA